MKMKAKGFRSRKPPAGISRRSKPPADIIKRIRKIGKVLELPETEVEAACANDRATVEFVRKHHQNLDWVWDGRMDAIIRSFHNLINHPEMWQGSLPDGHPWKESRAVPIAHYLVAA